MYVAVVLAHDEPKDRVVGPFQSETEAWEWVKKKYPDLVAGFRRSDGMIVEVTLVESPD